MARESHRVHHVHDVEVVELIGLGVREVDEIRFDVLYSSVPDGWRRGFTVVTALVLVVIFVWSFPAVIDYVTFMKVEHSSYIHVRLDYLFSVYIVFMVAAIARYLWLAYKAFRGNLPDETDPSVLREE